jgi:hypothetical protein
MKKLFLFAAFALAIAQTVQGSTIATETVFNTDGEKITAFDNAMITPVVISDYKLGGNDFDVCAVHVENIVFDFGRPVLNGIEPKFNFGFTRPADAMKHRFRCNDPPDLIS